MAWQLRFGTIRNNTALKRIVVETPEGESFGTIRNNTALKPGRFVGSQKPSFGTIRNNTALKPRRIIFLSKFRNRAVCPS